MNTTQKQIFHKGNIRKMILNNQDVGKIKGDTINLIQKTLEIFFQQVIKQVNNIVEKENICTVSAQTLEKVMIKKCGKYKLMLPHLVSKKRLKKRSKKNK